MSDENGEDVPAAGMEGVGQGEGDQVQFMRKDGVEKDGYICFPVDSPREEAVEEERKEEEEGHGDYTTCPEDPRFQQMNKTKWCYRMFVDYHRCRHLLTDSPKACDYFYRCYTSICPHAWVEKWEEQMEAGTFPRDVTRDRQPRPKPCP